MLDFRSYGLGLNLALFAAGAAFVWLAGTRLSRRVDALAARTGLGQVFLGSLLLGGVTSLPEAATTATAAATGNAPLAVNNVLGGVAMQVAVLALADVLVGRRAIAPLTGSAVVLLQGLLLVFTLAGVAAAVAAGTWQMGSFGVWTAVILLVVVVSLYLVKRYEAHPLWRPVDEAEPASEEERRRRQAAREQDERRAARREDSGLRERPLGRLVAGTAVASAVILAAGYAVARTGDALAEQTGLGASFAGAILVAIATSLPEVSTTTEAVRLGQYRLAFSNIFGTNLFDVGLLFLADVLYTKAPVLDEVGEFSQFGALLGILLMSVYLAGIVIRRERTVLRLGYDSVLVLVLYAGGVAVLWSLR